MNCDTFSYLVTNPGEITGSDLAYLKEIAQEYPFCQTARVLLAKGYAGLPESEEAIDSLRKAAAYALSRDALRKFIGGEYPPHATLNRTKLPFTRRHVEEVKVEKLKPESINPVQALRGLDYSEVLLQKTDQTPQQAAAKVSRLQEQLLLIDRFIQAEPRIGPFRVKPGPPNEEPEDLSRFTEIKDNAPITEVYAKVLVRQGKTDKAIGVYEKLLLKFPEKKAYFAEKIEELKKNS
ncbi:MAG: hypothetical protein QM669_03195 [Siphonobacter sp.]